MKYLASFNLILKKLSILLLPILITIIFQMAIVGNAAPALCTDYVDDFDPRPICGDPVH